MLHLMSNVWQRTAALQQLQIETKLGCSMSKRGRKLRELKTTKNVLIRRSSCVKWTAKLFLERSRIWNYCCCRNNAKLSTTQLKYTFSLRRCFDFVRASRLYKAAPHSMRVIYFKIQKRKKNQWFVLFSHRFQLTNRNLYYVNRACI